MGYLQIGGSPHPGAGNSVTTFRDQLQAEVESLRDTLRTVQARDDDALLLGQLHGTVLDLKLQNLEYKKKVQQTGGHMHTQLQNTRMLQSPQSPHFAKAESSKAGPSMGFVFGQFLPQLMKTRI